ncbi:MAG: GNAT family N-acetyltransferase [Actinobacteria bacterium]|nr:GNAT family N-acetyltransferase [Actinomycetota bacterium]MCA1721407.1 GNAT family N-acetyltransferase [Actinomycetota bacterium]
MAATPPGHVVTALRPARAEETAQVDGWRADPQTEYEEWGDPPPGLPPDAPWPKPCGMGELLITDGADTPIGTVGWHQVLHGPGAGSIALDIGISLRPEARGHGHGSRAQRMLADYLFATFAVHRVQASTDVTNAAEQGALERAGFTREGLIRGAQWRQGEWHDLVSYARLRTDA